MKPKETFLDRLLFTLGIAFIIWGTLFVYTMYISYSIAQGGIQGKKCETAFVSWGLSVQIVDCKDR